MHAVSHALSAHFNIHHGIGNAIALPHVLRFNCAVNDEPYSRMGNRLDLRSIDNSLVGAKRLLTVTDALLAVLEMPRTVLDISGLELDMASIDSVKQDMVSHIMEDPCLETNVCEVREMDGEIERIITAVVGL